ncbi:MAG: histidine kinase [Saprospirales bacterium]|jgi:two-component system LytT family sensor kinase|nr:histidine kinase [Saprospirales bacterium]
MYLPSRNTWLQILFWGGLWVFLPVILLGNWENIEWVAVRSAVVLSGIAITIWTNITVLLPRLYFNKKHLAYVLAGLAVMAAVTLMVHWDGAPWAEYFNRPGGNKGGGHGNPGFRSMKYIGMIMPYFTALIGSALFEIAGYANKKEKEATEFRSEKLEAELKFLKSQINPHFLFNALNNIYALTVIKSDQAPGNLLKLSGMLRYMLYDCKADRVPLGKEIDYLRHYIDLNLLKDSRGLNVGVQLDESRPGLSIAPMLLIPFVENAFKHSKIEDRDKGWISIALQTADDHILFEVQNSVPGQHFTKDESGGIGLANVRRQLELVYPHRHELSIDTSAESFRVHLKIQLS